MLQLTKWILLLVILRIHAIQETKEECLMMNHIANDTFGNWTTCASFLANTTFDPSTVLNVDWKIFYLWNQQYEDSYQVRYSLPYPELIHRFKESVSSDIRPPIDWSNAELFVETSIDLTGLFIRTNLSGQYRLIPSFLLHYKVPEMLYGLKVVDGILGMVNCERRYAYALAPVEKMPKPDQIEAFAAKIGFWNPMGRSYLVKPNETFEDVDAPLDLDDADDDVEIEIEKDKDVYQMF